MEARRPVQGLTIDGPASLDLDDALWLELMKDGSYQVDVSIADVAALYLTEEVEDAAAAAGFTRYWSGGNTPMLPREFSEGSVSLLPGEERQAMTMRIGLGRDDLAVQSFEVFPSILTSSAKLAYRDVDQYLQGSNTASIPEVLFHLNRVAQGLLVGRRAAGALAYYDLTRGWATTDEGQVIILGKERSHLGNIIVQEFMILANRLLAKWMVDRGIPGLFRVHNANPAAPDRTALLHDLERLREDGTSSQWAELCRDRVQMIVQKAEYSATPGGHWGLNLPIYVHATSPIRRYTDLLNWRQVKGALDNGIYCSPTYLQEHGERLTRIQHETQAKRAEAFRQTAQANAHRLGTSPGSTLSELDSGRFHHTLKACLRSAEGRASAGLKVEFRRRLKAEMLDTRDLYRVFFEPNPGDDEAQIAWGLIQQECLAFLETHASRAVSILLEAAQKTGLSGVRYHHYRGRQGPAHAPIYTFAAEVTRHTETVKSDVRTGPTKRAAQQAACVDLIAKLVGLSPTLARDTAKAVAVERVPLSPAKKAPQLEVADGNAVGALLQFCAQAKLPEPVFRFDRSGTQHKPSFACVCLALEREGTGSGRSKMEAKQAAANAIVLQVAAVQ